MPDKENKAHILYLHNTSEISGGERSLLALWECLGAEFQKTVILPEEGRLSSAAVALGVNVLIHEFPAIRPHNAFKIFMDVGYLCRVIKEQRVSLVHSYAPRNNLIGALAGRRGYVPVIWHERNIPAGGEFDVTKAFLFLPQAVVCNSHAVAARFNRNGMLSSKVSVIHNGVDLKHFCPHGKNTEYKKEQGAEDNFVIGMVTNLNERKRVDFLLEVAAALARDIPRLKVFVVGGEFPDQGGDRLRALKKKAEASGLAGHVVFTGFQDDVRPYLNAFDVFVHVTEKEACSRAILEAMAAGKPVVAVRGGGNPELVKEMETGFLLEGSDKQGFVGSIGKLFDDAPMRSGFGEAARRRAEKSFDVRENARLTQELYLRLTG